jgi:acetyl-CoA carboxylase biotin carboxyl carrier protein
MSVHKIAELLELMQKHDLVELKLEEGDLRITLRKQGAFPAPQIASPLPLASYPLVTAGESASGSAKAPPADDLDSTQITSPIVGTFHSSPAPDSPPYVEVGSRVTEDTVVCIVEAMKIMNEIRAQASGVIEKVLVESGEPVGYGQPLFLVRKTGAAENV